MAIKSKCKCFTYRKTHFRLGRGVGGVVSKRNGLPSSPLRVSHYLSPVSLNANEAHSFPFWLSSREIFGNCFQFVFLWRREYFISFISIKTVHRDANIFTSTIY